jgi:CHAT domain-containing protein
MTMKKWLIGICLGLMVSFAQAATQEEELKSAMTNYHQSFKLYQQHKFKEAIPLVEQAFKTVSKILDEKHKVRLNIMNGLAMLYQAKGYFDKALPLYEQSYLLRKEVYGLKHPKTLMGMNNLAKIYQDVGNFKKALPLFEKCYRLSKEVLGPKHPHTLDCLNNLAGIYKDLGRLNEALPLLEECYNLRKEVLGPKHPKTLISLNNLVGMYQILGHISKENLDLSKQSYILHKDVLGYKHPQTLASMNNLAFFYKTLGHFNEALPLYEQTYSLSKEVLGDKHPYTLQIINNFAGFYQAVGRFNKALELYEQAYHLRKETLGTKHPNTLESINNLASIYQAVGRLKEALDLYEQSYHLHKYVFGRKHPNTLTSMNNLALIYQDLAQLNKALPLYEKCYTLRKEVSGANHPNTLSLQNNLALIYKAVGRLQEALKLFEKAYPLSKKVLGPKHLVTLMSLTNLAYTYSKLGNIDKAIKHFEQLVKDVEAFRDTADFSAENRQAMFKQWVDEYVMLSGLYMSEKRLYDAFKTAEMTKARTLLQSMTSKLAAQQAGLSTIDLQKLQQNQAILSYLNQKIAKTSELDKRLNLEMKKNQFLKQAAEFHRSLMQKYSRYKQLNEIEIVNAKTGASLIPNDALFISYLINKDNDVLVFTLDNIGKLQAYYLGKIPNLDQTLKTYNTILGEQCTIKELRRPKCGGKYVWQIADGSFVIGQKPARNKKPKKVQELDKISRYLAQKLLQPLKANLQTKKRWIISPDGALALIPFESLIFEDKPLIANYSVSYVQSLSVLKLLKEREKQYQSKNRDTLLAMGAARYELPDKKITNRNLCNKAKRAPNFNLETMLSRDPQSYQRAFNTLDINWCNLPGSEKELRELENLFNKKSLWLRIKSLFVTTKTEESLFLKNQQASEAKLQNLNKNNKLTNYRYVLLSAHGYLSTETPALSAIVLDQQNKTPNTDGYITASEWPSYNLKSDLMVLSACQTANGKIVRGEGIIGLPYALYVAGNKNTLMTLWSVIDHSTADFTISFFSKLKQGMGQVEALTATKREFLKTDKYKRPLYWAGFVLYGI